ncbi:hypothetical protein D3C73_1353960 [compost metagenome]
MRIQIQLIARAQGLEVEVQNAQSQGLERIGLERQVLDFGIAVERPGIVGRDFALEPGAVACAVAGEKRVPVL